MEHLKVFWKRRGLLWELVKKGVRVKVQAVISWDFVVISRAAFNDDRIDSSVWDATGARG